MSAEARPVGLAVRPRGKRFDPAALSKEWEIGAPRANATTNGSLPDGGEPVILAAYPKVAKALRRVTTNPPDRSEDAWQVLWACYDAGLRQDQAEWVLRRRTDLADWLDENPASELDRTWNKIAQKREEREDGSDRDDIPKRWNALDLEPAKQPRWIAESRLPRAAICLLLGDEGIGKSLFWVLIVAHITTGTRFSGFGMPPRRAGRALLVLTEDDWCSFVRPRLEVVKADLDRIELICVDKEGNGSPVFPRDIGLCYGEPKPDIVVVDCWLDTVPSSLQITNPQHARQALHPWKDVATRNDACVLLIAHTNRVPSPKPRDRYGGTYALRQKARLTLYAQQDEDGNLLVGPEKANGAAIKPASILSIATEQFFEKNFESDGIVPLLKYQGESDRTSREHLADSVARGSHSVDAQLWLRVFLSLGPRWVDEIEEAAKGADITDYKLHSAKRELKVASVRAGTLRRWYWALPQHEGQMPKGAAEQGVEKGAEPPKIDPLPSYEVRAGFASTPYVSSTPYKQGVESDSTSWSDNTVTSQDGEGSISGHRENDRPLTSDPQVSASDSPAPCDTPKSCDDIRRRFGAAISQQTFRTDANSDTPCPAGLGRYGRPG